MKAILTRPGSLVAILLSVGLFLIGSAALKSYESIPIIAIVQVAVGVGAILVALLVLARRAMAQRHGDRL
jgi:hypothetical protein